MCDHHSCELTAKDIEYSINDLATKEKKHREMYQMYEELVYECSRCKNGFHIIGEILECSKCNRMICLDCVDIDRIHVNLEFL